jgi:putative ABC transport system permease protein
VGCLPEYQSISNLELLTGDFITQDDQDGKSKVAVIGYNLAKTLFGGAYAAEGGVMTIEGKTYDVVGVLASMGTVSSGISPDDSIYLPYSTAQKFVLGSTATPTITAIASDVTQVSTVMANIKTVLTENYPKGQFTLTDAGSEMEAATTSANTLSMLLIAVAIIVFIVGGIGIMNVLFVSVQERTQEIGILKALGCSKREILLEFLAEANMIGTFGGIVGVAAGFALVPVLRMTGMTVEPLAIGGVLALVFAIVTGTVFGFYPAYKAAQLTPIEALSQE